MKKKLLLLLCMVLNLGISYAQSAWPTTRVGDSVLVAFPGRATLTEQTTSVGKVTTYLYRDSTDTYTVLVKSTPMQAEASAAEVQRFYTGVLQGLGNHIVRQQPVTIRGYAGLQAQYSTPDQPNLPAVKYLQVVLINGTAYIQQVWTDVEQTGVRASNRRRFFASLHPLAPKPQQVPDYVETTSSSYRIGKLLGSVVGIGAVLGTLFLIGFWLSNSLISSETVLSRAYNQWLR